MIPLKFFDIFFWSRFPLIDHRVYRQVVVKTPTFIERLPIVCSKHHECNIRRHEEIVKWFVVFKSKVTLLKNEH